MAKQRDDKNPKRRPEDDEALEAKPIDDLDEVDELDEIEEAEEVVEIVDAEEPVPAKPAPATPKKEPEGPVKTQLAGKSPEKTKMAGRAPQKTHLANRGGQPTMLSQEDPDDPAFAGMPNLSLDDAKSGKPADLSAKELVEAEEVLGDEALEKTPSASPVVVGSGAVDDAEDAVIVAEEAGPGGSSVVDVAALVEEVDEESPDVLAHDSKKAGSSVVDVSALVEDVDEAVLADDAQKAPGGSSVIDISALVEDGGSGAKAPPPMGDDLFTTEDEDESAQAASIFTSGVEDDATIVSDSMARKEEAIEEILEGTDDRPADVDDETVDLGSEPEIDLEAAPKRKKAKKKKVQDDDEVQWDDADDKSKKVAGDLDLTVAFDPDAKKDDDDELAEDALLDEEEAVELGEKPLSGIDHVAEALESGTNLEDDEVAPRKKKKAAAEKEGTDLDAETVEEAEQVTTEDEADDALFEDDEEEKPRKKARAAALDDDELAAAALLDDDEVPVAKKKGKAADDEADLADDLAADALLSDDDEEPVVTGKKKAKDEEEEADLFADDEEPVGAKKKGKKGVDEDDDAELVGAGAGKRAAAKPMAKPRYGRRWLGGMFLMTLLLGGGAAAVWYLKPDLLEQAYKSSPAYVAPKKEKAKVDPPAVVARNYMDEKDFDSAIKLLADSEETPVNLSTKAEARWLKYLQEQTAGKKPLKRDDKEVEQVLGELKKANNDLLLSQVNRALDESELRAGLKANEKTLSDLRAQAEKAETAHKEAEKVIAGMAETLVKEKILGEKDKLDPAAFQKIVTDLSQNKTVLAAVNKMLEDAKIKEAGDKGVEKLVLAKKDLDEKLDAVNKLLADEKLKDDGAKGLAELIAARNKLAKDREELDLAIKTAYKELATGGLVPPSDDPRGKIIEAVKIARTKAESPLAIPLTALANALSGVGVGAGHMIEKGFDVAALTTELSYYRLREPLITGPDRKMDAYINLFQDPSRKDNGELATALKEASWLLSKEAKASPEARAKALYVTGLAQRNQEKFDDAKKTLEEALKQANKLKDAAWSKQAETALKEFTQADTYYLPRAERFADDGNYKKAEEVLTLGLKAMPDNPRLLALRGLVRLEDARASGSKTKISGDVQKAIRSDAEAAAKDESAAAHAAFVLGQLEEELGNWDQAEKEYRNAIKTHKGNADDASRYVIALARLLQRERVGSPAPMIEQPKTDPKKIDLFELKKFDLDAKKKEAEAPKKEEVEPKVKDDGKKKEDIKKKDDDEPKKEDVEPKAKEDAKKKDDVKKKDDLDPKKEPEPKKDDARLDTLRALVTLALVGVQLPGEDEDEDPVAAARLQESIDLANKLIKSANPKVKGQGYMLLGQALSKKGKRTEGMREYVKGLELLFPGAQSKDMTKLLEEHPAFQQPDAVTRVNPVVAEQFFGKGLHLYYSRQYAEAEIQFKQAIMYYPQDARYQYYLGLSLLPQKGTMKRDAASFALEQGARLEASNRPSTGEINLSLERIQGPLRAYLNAIRQKALVQ